MVARARAVTHLLLALVAVLAEHALAADQPVSVKRLVIRRAASGAESLVLISRHPNVLFPALLSGDDPTGSPGGATLELLPPSGANVTLSMPGGDGVPGWTAFDGAVDRYRFRNDAAPDGFSSVRAALLKQGSILRIVGRQAGLPLDAPLGRLALRFTTGSLRSCAVLEGASIVADAPGRFVARNASAPAAADCTNLSLGVPACGNGVRELAEQCDGSDAPSCPGQCLSDCTCPPVCGDGVVNQPSEQCDAPSGSTSCPAGYFGCRGDCSCCSSGYQCDLYGCCEPNRLCIQGPSGFGTCYKAFCPPSSPSCEDGLVCESFAGPTGSIDVCCEPEPGDGCLYLGVGPPCCNGLVCDNIPGQGGRCCVPAGGACTQATDCCSNVCDGSNVCQ